MRILIVGAGGVGSAAAKIAARRDFFEHLVLADYDAGKRAGGGRSRPPTRGCTPPRVDASVGRGRGRAVPRRGHHARAQRRRPALRHAGVRGRPRRRGRLPGHGDELSRPHPDEPYRVPGVKLGDEQFAAAQRWEQARAARAGRDRRRAGAVRRLRPLRRRSPVHRDRRARHPRRRRPGAGRLRLRPVVLDLDHHRGVPQPAGDLGAGSRLVHRPSRSASRRSSTSRTASARSSA